MTETATRTAAKTATEFPMDSIAGIHWELGPAGAGPGPRPGLDGHCPCPMAGIFLIADYNGSCCLPQLALPKHPDFPQSWHKKR